MIGSQFSQCTSSYPCLFTDIFLKSWEQFLVLPIHIMSIRSRSQGVGKLSKGPFLIRILWSHSWKSHICTRCKILTGYVLHNPRIRWRYQTPLVKLVSSSECYLDLACTGRQGAKKNGLISLRQKISNTICSTLNNGQGAGILRQLLVTIDTSFRSYCHQCCN